MLPRGPFVLRTGSCMIRTVAEGMGLHTRWNETDGEAADFTERTASSSTHSQKLTEIPSPSAVPAGEKPAPANHKLQNCPLARSEAHLGRNLLANGTSDAPFCVSGRPNVPIGLKPGSP